MIEQSTGEKQIVPFPREHEDKVTSLIERLLNEDRAPRDTMIRLSKKLELYFKGYQRLFWSERLGDWSAPGLPNFDPAEFADKIDPGDLEVVPKTVNFYRAFGETVIAALSSGIPYVKFFPEDADSFDDLTTAAAYRKLADKIERDNEIETLFVKALFILWNQHFVAFYNYAHQSDDYGYNKEPVFENVEKNSLVNTCPQCGNETTEQVDPNTLQPQDTCPTCGPVQPVLTDKTETINEQTGTKDIAKVREIVEAYGILNVAVPSYVSDIKATPYLVLETEIHEGLAKELILTDPDLDQETKLDLVNKVYGTNQYQTYERWGRTPLEYYGSDSRLVTLRRVWLRPWCVNLLGLDPEEAQSIKEEFPTGLFVIMMNRVFIKAKEERLDDHWTVSRSPLSSTIHASPLGLPAQDIQDMKNDLVNIEFQTCQFGIPETFADPEVVDFRAYQKLKAQPGMLTPVKQTRPDKGLQDSFYTIKTATLGQEVPSFESRLEQDGQFVTGALPSVFGGSIEGGSKTLGEYEKSGAQALQRLSLTWKMLNNTYRKTIAKSVKEYRDNLEFDEKFVTKHGDSFLNVWIKLDELQGNVGDVTSESSDQFPMSWTQKRDAIMNLLNLKDPQILQVIYNPNNAQMIADYLGFSELYIPGADDRNVQLQEIKELLKGQPIENPSPTDPNTGQPAVDPNTGQPPPPTFTPSVGIQPSIDNHQIHIAVCQAFLNSARGRALLLTNKPAYDNVTAHLQQHEQFLMSQPQPAQGESQNG